MTRYVTIFDFFMFGSLLFWGAVPRTAVAASVETPLLRQPLAQETPNASATDTSHQELTIAPRSPCSRQTSSMSS